MFLKINIKDKLSCTYCHEIFKHPINLICCGKKICKQHIDELIKQDSPNTFTCPLCAQENTNQNFHCDELFESLIEEVELHKFKLDPKYELTFHNLRKEIESLEKVLNGPESYIYEEINELKRQVDLDRENLKSEIDNVANGLIQQLESYEQQFKKQYKTTVDFNYYSGVAKSSRAKLDGFKKFLNLFSVGKEERDEKTSEMEREINSLEPILKKFKCQLFSNLEINYKQMQMDKDEFFARLIIEVKVYSNLFIFSRDVNILIEFSTIFLVNFSIILSFIYHFLLGRKSIKHIKKLSIEPI